MAIIDFNVRYNNPYYIDILGPRVYLHNFFFIYRYCCSLFLVHNYRTLRHPSVTTTNPTCSANDSMADATCRKAKEDHKNSSEEEIMSALDHDNGFFDPSKFLNDTCNGSDIESGDDKKPSQWCPSYNWVPSESWSPTIHRFTATSKISVDTSVDTSNFNSVSYLKLFLTDQLISHVVVETNRYAKQYIKSNPNASRWFFQRFLASCNSHRISPIPWLDLLHGCYKETHNCFILVDLILLGYPRF